MSDLPAILIAFDQLGREGKSAALATIIRIAGSAYRRPGARLLIAEDGRTVGAISGGCLEKDVCRRARLLIGSDQCDTHIYDSAEDDDLSPRTATGCGGAVEIFIQPLSPARPGPITFFRQCLEQRQPLTLATILQTDSLTAEVGDCFLPDFPVPESATTIQHLNSTEIFLEHLTPPPSLLIFGQGPELIPLQTMANLLGWHVRAISTHDIDNPQPPMESSSADAVILMTRNLHADARILASLPADLRYLGILGPRHRTRKLLAIRPQHRHCFSPIGLDIGAETPQEIALAIISEIQAVLSHRPGGSLRDHCGPIHENRAAESNSLPLPSLQTCRT